MTNHIFKKKSSRAALILAASSALLLSGAPAQAEVARYPLVQITVLLSTNIVKSTAANAGTNKKTSDGIPAMSDIVNAPYTVSPIGIVDNNKDFVQILLQGPVSDTDSSMKTANINDAAKPDAKKKVSAGTFVFKVPGKYKVFFKQYKEYVLRSNKELSFLKNTYKDDPEYTADIERQTKGMSGTSLGLGHSVTVRLYSKNLVALIYTVIAKA